MDVSYDNNEGLVAFSAAMSGITTAKPYFYLDFTTANTVVWGSECQHDAMGTYEAGACSSAPTNMKMAFDGDSSDLPSYFSAYTDMTFGGYVVSGERYQSKLCIDISATECMDLIVYSGDSVSENNWLWN